MAKDFKNPLNQSIIRTMSTGLISAEDGYDILSINGSDNTKFDLKTGRGQIVDNSDPDNPILKEITWEAQSGISLDNLSGQAATYISIDENSQIIQEFPVPSEDKIREQILIGVLEHQNLAVITKANNVTVLAFNSTQTNFWDLAFNIGNINRSGNIITPNGNSLKIDKSSGTVLFPFINSGNDINNPNISNELSRTAFTFVSFYTDNNGTALLGSVTDEIDPDNYNNTLSGTLITIPDNKYTIQRVFMSTNNGNISVKYGQNLFDSQRTAYNSLLYEPQVEVVGESTILLIAYIIIKQGSTDLSDTSQAIFINSSKFGDLRQTSTSLPSQLNAISQVPFTFTSNGIGTGIYYSDGSYYYFNSTDANLDEGSTTVTWGTADISYAAHVSVIAGGAGTTDGSDLILTVSGTSITDSGVRTVNDTEVVVADCTTTSANEYFETTKKWLGTITYTLTSTAGTTFSFDFNYGYSKYEDLINRDVYLTGFQFVGLGGADDSGNNVRLRLHDGTGWTYATTGFQAGGTILADMQATYVTEYEIANGQYFSFKKDNINTFINGSQSDGVVVEITAGSNNTYQSVNGYILIEL